MGVKFKIRLVRVGLREVTFVRGPTGGEGASQCSHGVHFPAKEESAQQESWELGRLLQRDEVGEQEKKPIEV